MMLLNDLDANKTNTLKHNTDEKKTQQKNAGYSIVKVNKQMYNKIPQNKNNK